jgi:non-ribosomal peptide synthetase component F
MRSRRAASRAGWRASASASRTSAPRWRGFVAEDADTALPALRRVFMIGDALARSDVALLHALAPNARVTNLYGATETQRALGYFEVERAHGACEARGVVPLGQGMPGAQLLVLNAAGERAGIGEAGEIHVRSPHLARGYRGDPELTAQRFLVNPFTSRAGDRLYRTGDLGRYRGDGAVECSGRADTQVKLRGFRIELGAIESLLARSPDVRAAAATIHGSDADDRRIVAYVVPREGARSTSRRCAPACARSSPATCSRPTSSSSSACR